MANIHDYLHWRGDLPIEQFPFNEVDALILAKLSYIPFEKISLQSESTPISIRAAALSLLALPDLEQCVHLKDDIDLLRELSGSLRFCCMQLTNYVNQIEEENQTQFSAITVHVTDQFNYAVFRGTDATLVGWKENFNMSFIFPVPAQKRALKYLEDVSTATDSHFIVAGHSKGGNLAMYAAAFCNKETQDRITAVYNFDGPGFNEKVLVTPEYQRICSKMTTFVPQDSIVGLLLEHEEQYIIVKSMEKSVMQHDISSWEVERDHLFYLDQVTNSSQFIDRTLKGWIADMDVGQREKFVDALYSILAKTKAHTLQELDDRWFECTMVILSTLGSLDEETRKLITEALSLLVKNAKKNFGQISELWEVHESVGTPKVRGNQDMNNVIITVESGSDMPKDLAQYYGIRVVPMHITFGNQTKDDGSFPVSDICDYYETTGNIPKTSGSTPSDFITIFEQIHKEYPKKSILHLAYSAVTTCSYQSAVLASEGCDYIACVDTKQVTVGQTAIAVRVAQELKKHPEWSLEEAVQFAQKVIKSTEMCFAPQNLSFLRAGGRVSNAAALIWNILHLHPVIELKSGRLVAVKKLRGKMERTIPKLMEEFTTSKNLDREMIWLGSTIGLPEDVKRIAEDTAHKLGFQTIYWISAGGVITTHGGPGAFAMAGYSVTE